MTLLIPLRCLLYWRRWASAPLLSALAAAILLPVAAPAMAWHAVISHADGPAQLIRKAIVHRAPAGVPLQAGDIVESGTSMVQLEWPDGARLALGPASSMLVGAEGDMATVSVLRGWAKFATTAPAGGRLTLEAGPMRLLATGTSGILHLAADKTEFFVETGAVSATDNDLRPARSTTVGREQYAVRAGARQLAVAPRAPRLFVQGMPRAFLDPLVAVAARTLAAVPVPQRPLSAADIGAWRDAGLPLRTRLARQFAARLSDPVFRNQIEDMVDNHPEWRDLLRRQRAPKGRAYTPHNQLF